MTLDDQMSIKTNTKLHGIPQNRQRCFYLFWKGQYVPVLQPSVNIAESLTDYLNKIPRDASQQNLLIKSGKPSELYLPYKFLLEDGGWPTHELFQEFCVHSDYPGSVTIAQILMDTNKLDQCIKWLKDNGHERASFLGKGKSYIDQKNHWKTNRMARDIGTRV